MAAKFTFLFCAFVLVSAFALPSTTQLNDSKIIDFIKKAVHKVEEVLDKAISEGTKLIDGFANNWDDYQAKIVSVTSKALTKAQQKIEEIMDRIAEKSDDSGKKLVKCIEASEADIVAVQVNFFDDTTKCFSSELVGFVQTLGPLLKDLAGVHEEAKAAADQIDACQGDDVQGFLCVANVAAELIQIAAEIPERVKGDITPVYESIVKLYKAALQCGRDNTDSYYVNFGKVLDTVATCVAA